MGYLPYLPFPTPTLTLFHPTLLIRLYLGYLPLILILILSLTLIDEIDDYRDYEKAIGGWVI